MGGGFEERLAGLHMASALLLLRRVEQLKACQCGLDKNKFDA